MVDIHAHILPGIDDGAEDMNSALEMAALAVESGVEMIVATPHSSAYGRQKNQWGRELKSALLAFRAELEREKIPLRVYSGMEIYGSPEVPELLTEGRLIGLNGSRYPLIEFAFTDYAVRATEILEEVIAIGKTPVVAHPERYLYVQEDPTLLNLWVEMGCLLQINKGSLLGRHGRQEELLSLALVERGFACAVASDAHSPVMRTTWMKEAEKLLTEEFSPGTAKRLLTQNPVKLLKNESIQLPEPEWF